MANDLATPILGDLESLTNDPKAIEDYSESLKQFLPRIDAFVEAGRTSLAIDEILSLEKKCRQASDAYSTSKLCCKLLEILHNEGHWENLNEYLVLMCKKRGQLKRSIIDMVQLCMKYLEEENLGEEIKASLLNTLLTVTEGKIFVEVERARLTLSCAYKLEKEGKINDAAVMLQDVQVETLGSMDKIEKAEYILEQMRLLLLKTDYVRFQIVSRKINFRLLDADEFQDIKIKYYNYMIEYYIHENRFLDVCKSYYSLLNTPCIKNNQEKCKDTMENYILFLLLTPFCNEQQDMLNRLVILEKKKLDQNIPFKKLVDLFITYEIISFNFPYKEIIMKHSVFDSSTPGTSQWETFKKRITQHNIRVIGKYYSQITLENIVRHLDIPMDQAEFEIAELVMEGDLIAKIDRPAQIVHFGNPKTSTDYLSQWSYDIGKGIDLIEETYHLIQKEQMIFSARQVK